jgi:hypothetical protein
VLTNNGSGGFGLSSSPVVGEWPVSLVAADVNGDGKVDLISANYNDSTLTVLINNGFTFQGNFVGSGAGLTSLNAAYLTGTVADRRLSRNVALLDATQMFTGGNSFSGPCYFQGNVGIGAYNPQSKLDVHGTVRTYVLQVTGGADLAEHFTVDAALPHSQFKVEPGMVVSIDPIGNRKFKLADEPYDRKRVGIISGGNGVKAGLVLRDEGNPQADGDQPIALTGQVWCHADASFGPITPGDLLTTSSTPGHAMKVTDLDKARLAVLGQALTALKEGRGWVQVLVGKE